MQIDCPYESKEEASDPDSDDEPSGYDRKYSSRQIAQMNQKKRHLIWIQMKNLPVTKGNIHPSVGGSPAVL